jgi:hypothetical protein
MQKKPLTKFSKLSQQKLWKTGNEGMYPNIIKALYDKPIANIINGGKAKIISPNVRNETKVFTLSTLIQYSTGIPNQRNKRRKK